MRWLYAPWAFLVCWPVVLVATAFWSSLAWAWGHFDTDRAYEVCARAWARMLCAVNFTRVCIQGFDKIDRRQAYVIMSNHQSHFDILAVAAKCPLKLRWLMKQELREVPALGAATAKVGCVFVDRRDREASIASLRAPATVALLERGVSLFVFPEGTRSRDGQLGPFKKGGFMVALELGIPILPISIRGSGRVLPRGSLRLLPGRIDLVCHRPVEVAPYAARREQLVEEVRRVIAQGSRGPQSDAPEPASGVERP